MIRALAAVFVLLLAGSVRADPYASLKPLIGRWLVDKDCVVSREKSLITVSRQPHSMHLEFFDPSHPDARLGAGDIVNVGVEDHYRVSVQIPDNPVLKALGLSALPGTLIISDDTDDPDSPGKDYMTSSLNVSVFHSQTTVKFREHFRKATFLFQDETPMGKDQCRGAAVKQKAPPKYAAAPGR